MEKVWCGCEFEGECICVLPVPGDLTPAAVALVQSRTALAWGLRGSAKGMVECSIVQPFQPVPSLITHALSPRSHSKREDPRACPSEPHLLSAL